MASYKPKGRLRKISNAPNRVGRAVRPKGARPVSSASMPAVQSSITALRKEAKRKLALRARVGLLKNKSQSDDLNEVERKMLDHELAIAEELQAGLLPQKIPQIRGLDLSAYYRPSREVGGDYYDFIEIDRDNIGIIVADVSGKGIPGSIVMTETRALMKSEGSRTLSPAEALSRVNRVLYQDIKRGMFVTAFYLVLDISSGIITVTSAGHNPMILWRCATNACHLVNPNGLALGIDKGPLFEKAIKEQRIQLHKGDRFISYTDGVVEVMDEKNEQNGPEWFYARAKRLSSRTSGEFITQVVKEMEAFQGNAPQHDDITIVTGRAVGTSGE